MKRILQHPPETPATQSGKKYWRSLAQLEDTPEFRGWLEREFPAGASELAGDSVSRRNFLKLMGASTALAGLSLSGCRRPEKQLVPFTRAVEWSIPGKALFYATAMPTRRGAAPLVVTTYDGRPTKIEGNPLHPASGGRTDTFSQSSVLDLYDPDRARFFYEHQHKADSAGFEKALDTLLKSAGDGAGLALLLEKCNSPTRERLRLEIERKYPKVLWAVYEPLGGDAADEAGRVSFGDGVAPVPAIDKADVILSLDCDFLGCEVGNLEGIRAFAARRKVDGPEAKMNRLYVVENRYTVTGGIADHRLRLPASQVGAFALALAGALGVSKSDPALRELEGSAFKFNADWIKYCAEDLASAKGRSLVLVGTQQPAAVQVLVAAINAALGSFGATLHGRAATERPAKSISELAQAVRDKQVRTLFIVGGNPIYNAPADLEWSSLQSSIETVIRFGFHEDETSQPADWRVPLAHYLESWGDARATDGSYVAVQPMILPLHGGWSEIDLLARLAGRPKPTGPELIQETFREVAKPADFVGAWAELLRTGFLAGSAAKMEPLVIKADAATFVSENAAAPAMAEGAYEVVLVADSKLDDGRFNNNGWLQECPDPTTKLTWDNAAQLSPASARKLGVKTGDFIEISIEKRALKIPALVAPGHADYSITIPLGYGRTVTGRVGRGSGFDAYPLRTTSQPYFTVGASVKAVGGSYALAITQEHGALEGRGPDITREATLDEFKADPLFAKTSGMDAHIPKNVSLYSNPPLNLPNSIDPHAWGMTVDLNACIGCSACMVACQSENNIPIVGKEQVIKGREMHWIRADRYFASVDETDPEPEMISQPMMCQHCENAPCETVCPVNATVHSEDGLNVMAYNRCIGTRYCANNCPFKVRRFNFFDYNQRDVLGREAGKPFSGLYEPNAISPKGTPETLKLQKNPNVTVRMRGVMEKCTFCVQRIQEAKIATKVAARDSANVRVPVDAFTVACAQACPTDAITFGDFNNPNSSASKLKAKERGYRLLEYLNINTRVWYLARIRNPNMKMPGAEKIGAAMKSHHSPHHKPGDNHAAPAVTAPHS